MKKNNNAWLFGISLFAVVGMGGFLIGRNSVEAAAPKASPTEAQETLDALENANYIFLAHGYNFSKKGRDFRVDLSLDDRPGIVTGDTLQDAVRKWKKMRDCLKDCK